MDCSTINEIYKKSCTDSYKITGVFVTTNLKIKVEDLQLKADNNCLRSIEMLEKYCKNEINNKK